MRPLPLGLFAAACLLAPQPCSARLDPLAASMASDFFRHRNAHTVVTYTCSEYDSRRLSHHLLARHRAWLMLSPDPRNIPYGSSVFLDYGCERNQVLLAQCAKAEMMNTSTRWLVWSTQEPDERLQVRVDSDVTWATWRVGWGDAVLWGLIRLHPGWPLARWPVGRWAPAAGLQYDNRRLQWVAKKNLQGLALGAALPIVDTPLDNLGERLKNVNDRQLDTMARFGWGLSTTLARLLNFSIILYRVRNFGSLVSDNEMDGAVALIHNGTVEFGAAGFIMTTRRMDFMDYTGPGRLWAPEIMFRHPKSASVLTTIFKPYTAELWVSSGALFVLILVVSRLFCWVEHRVTATVDEIDNSWNSTFLLVSSAIGQQGVSRSSEWLSWRVLLFVSFLCTNLLDTHYAAGIVSSLLMPPPRTINNKKDLADSPLGFGLENVSYTYQFFVKSDDPVDRALCSRKLYPPGGRPNFFPAEVGVRKMATELFAFHAEDVRVGPLIDRFFSDDDKCALVFIPLLTPVATYTAVRRNSPVKELFNFGLRMMWERGHISYLRKAWYFTRVRCLSETEYASVDLVPMSPAFMLLGCAIFLSGLLLLLEVRQYRRSQTEVIPVVPNLSGQNLKKKLGYLQTGRQKVRFSSATLVKLLPSLDKNIYWDQVDPSQ